MRGVKFTHVPTECNSDDCVECHVRSKLAICAFDAEVALEQQDFNRLDFKRWFISNVKKTARGVVVASLVTRSACYFETVSEING